MMRRSLYPHFMKPYDRNKPERRRDVRVPLDAPIWLRLLGSESDASVPHIEGRIMNISKRGMKLRLPSALEPGMSVQARMGGKIIMAEVRYCLVHGDEFHVGVEIQDVFPIPGSGGTE
jgi:c-di-GMP-binding flagellar brake protein YcgR